MVDVNASIKEVERVVTEEVKTVTIELTMDEASELRSFLGAHVLAPGGVVSKVFYGLDGQGVTPLRGPLPHITVGRYGQKASHIRAWHGERQM